MAYRGSGVQCYASCPPSTVTIQPPPFTLTIPGPALYCPDQPMNIQQYNPCENVRGGGGMSMIGSAGLNEVVLADIGNDDEYRRWPYYGGGGRGGRPWRGGGGWRGPWWRRPWADSCLED